MAHVELAAKDLSASGWRGGPTGALPNSRTFPSWSSFRGGEGNWGPQPSAFAVAAGPTCKAHMPEPIKQLEGEE